MNFMSKGPQGPRRSSAQATAARKKREALEQARQEDMAEKMREAYEKTQRRSMSGMKKGGAVKSSASKRADGIAKKGKTRGKFV
jgi:hypothetical protein